jgi:hypothetical protein
LRETNDQKSDKYMLNKYFARFRVNFHYGMLVAKAPGIFKIQPFLRNPICDTWGGTEKEKTICVERREKDVQENRKETVHNPIRKWAYPTTAPTVVVFLLCGDSLLRKLP